MGSNPSRAPDTIRSPLVDGDVATQGRDGANRRAGGGTESNRRAADPCGGRHTGLASRLYS
ncbi:hypothetical protein GCM10010383_31490 [Streptomyces lomondensis]|uniref:Uncharacterized protein n=1 Tax=Streptomyces lomondensis TaxID=68229 RepID=A0ABQ2X4I6_9ACTN|nr:hypothetical protein GCM10010383_31490 [Streptomyces lomondensis]